MSAAPVEFVNTDVAPWRPAPATGVDLAVELAHDIRSPLSAIMSLAELLASGAYGSVTPAQRRQLDVMRQAANGVARVTTDIVDYGRLGLVNGGEPTTAFSVDDVLARVREVAQPMARCAGLRFVVRNHAPSTWLGRPSSIERVLLNLATNALKYTRSGVVEIGARMQGAARLEFFVRDTGGGLEAGGHRRSEPAADERWRRAGGGLGLAISRRLLHAMGSTLEVESRPGDGCRFHFVISLRENV